MVNFGQLSQMSYEINDIVLVVELQREIEESLMTSERGHHYVLPPGHDRSYKQLVRPLSLYFVSM